MPAPPFPRRALVACLMTLALLAAACTGERPTLADETEETITTEATTSTTEPALVGADVAQAKNPSIDVFASEDAEAPERQMVSGVDTSVDTIPIVFLVETEATETTDRLEVHLPAPPAGSLGWVNAADVTVTTVPYRIEVGLTEHRLRVFDGEAEIIDEPVGIGPTDRPEPGGTYFIRELLQPPDPGGVYGSFAYGLSGSPNLLEGVDVGAGVIGIHGTSDPATLGQDAPGGSIGLANEVIERLVNDIGLPLGTPVEVAA